MGSKGIIFTLDAILTISLLAIFIFILFSIYRGYYYSFYEYDVKIRDYLLVSDLLRSLEKRGVLNKLMISKEQRKLLVENAAELGYSYVTPFLSNQRAICRDGKNYVHIVWRYNQSIIKYARSTDDGRNFQVRDLDNSSYLKGTPHISCYRNLVTIGYKNSTGLTIAISEDNGESFTFRAPRSQNVDEVLVEGRGERIYVIYKDSQDPSSIIFFFSNNSGNTWSGDLVLFQGMEEYLDGILQWYSTYSLPSFTIEGNGSSADRLNIVAVQYYWEFWISGYYVYFRSSTNGGITWTDPKLVGSSNSKVISLTFLSNANFMYIAFINESFSIFFTNSSNYGENWSNFTQISNGSLPEFNVSYPTITLNSLNLPVIFYSKNIGVGSRIFLTPDGVMNIGYKVENSTATSPDGASIPLTPFEYSLINKSDLHRLNVSPIDNSAFTRFVFNLSKFNIFSHEIINLTYALQGHYSGDLARIAYKYYTSWVVSDMSTVEQYFTRTFSGLSIPGIIQNGSFQLGTSQQNTSVGLDYTFINHIYLNITYRLPLQIAYTGFFRGEWKNEDFLEKGLEDNLFLNSRAAYAGNSLELVYGKGRGTPYKIVYIAIKDWEEIAKSELAGMDRWKIELMVEPIQIKQIRYMRSDMHSVNGLSAYKFDTKVSNQLTSVEGDCIQIGNFYFGIRVWRRLSNRTEIEITNGTPVGIASLSVGRTTIVVTLSSTWQAPEKGMEPTDSLVIRVYGGIDSPPDVLLATFTTEVLGAHKLLPSTWRINYRVLREVIEFDSIGNCFHFLFGISGNNSFIENLTYELSPIWLNYSYNWDGSETFMAKTFFLFANLTEAQRGGDLGSRIEVESGSPYSVVRTLVKGLRSTDLNLPENTTLSVKCEVLDLLDRKVEGRWEISALSFITVNSSYRDFNICNITIPEIVHAQKYKVNVTLSNSTYEATNHGFSEFYVFKPGYAKLYLTR